MPNACWARPGAGKYNLGDLLRRPGVDFDKVCEVASIAAAK